MAALAQSYLDQAFRLACQSDKAGMEVLNELMRHGCRPGTRVAFDLASRASDNVQILKRLVHDCKIDLQLQECEPTSKASALGMAAKNGHVEMCRYLIQMGFDLEKKDTYQQTPLHWAASYGHAEICHMLVGAGANLEAVDKLGYTPFLWAVRNGRSLQVLKIVKYDACYKRPAPLGQNAFFLSQSGATTEWLLEQDEEAFEQINASEDHRQTPLFYAVDQSNAALAEVLMKNGADVNHRDGDGKTCLFYAIAEGQEDMVRYLLQRGANASMQDNSGRTAAAGVKQKKDNACLKLLQKFQKEEKERLKQQQKRLDAEKRARKKEEREERAAEKAQAKAAARAKAKAKAQPKAKPQAKGATKQALPKPMTSSSRKRKMAADKLDRSKRCKTQRQKATIVIFHGNELPVVVEKKWLRKAHDFLGKRLRQRGQRGRCG